MVQRVDELERIADPIAVLAFRITAIRLVLRARGEEAAGVPRRRRARASAVHEIRECSPVAMAPHRDAGCRGSAGPHRKDDCACRQFPA